MPRDLNNILAALTGRVILTACLLLVLHRQDHHHASANGATVNNWGKPKSLFSVKVINGKTIHIDTAKFMVQLVAYRGTTRSACGGTLVSTTIVLTAAHCVNGIKPGELYVFVGSSEFEETGRAGAMVAVRAVKIHKSYKEVHEGKNAYALYDVAVVKLKTAVKLGPKVALIGVVGANQQTRPGAMVTVSGWGVYKQGVNDETSRKLRTASYKVISNDVCKKAYANRITDVEFCISSKPTSSFCSGDSGGGVYIGNQQHGIVSWGSCGEDFLPSVVTNLAHPSINAFVKSAIASF